MIFLIDISIEEMEKAFEEGFKRVKHRIQTLASDEQIKESKRIRKKNIVLMNGYIKIKNHRMANIWSSYDFTFSFIFSSALLYLR